MRKNSSLITASRCIGHIYKSQKSPSTFRYIHISQAPTTETPITGSDAFGSYNTNSDSADARFEVLGAPYSLLSVSLSASQKLFTQRGTLVGVSGNAENARSTLSVLSPLKRAFTGVPFLYQKITSTTPITALIGTKSATTTISVVHLNGTVDWMVASRKALLAWTGHTLSLYPTTNTAMSLSHWGNTQLTGRGLVALAGKGQIYEVTLKAGEQYTVHPGNVVAYTVTQNPPLPYRFKSGSLRLQVPSFGLNRIPTPTFLQTIRDSSVYKGIGRVLYNIRTVTRRTIWGDNLFLSFQGPTTLLLSSRASRMSEVLTDRDLKEVADSRTGEARKAVSLPAPSKQEETKSMIPKDTTTAVSGATVGADGEVRIEKTDQVKL